MLQGFVVPPKTRVTSKGDGPALALNGAAHRVFLITLKIDAIVEQESLELSLWGSADGTTWTPKPVATFPQKFYTGETPLLLDLTALPDVQHLRAHWEVSRWGRGDATPMFEFEVAVREVPPEFLKQQAS
jgi:hypothetical protein